MNIEQLDDLPLLGNQMNRVSLVKLLNDHFPDHGNWKGISGGKTIFGWLLYILSEGDHRLSLVEDWAGLRMNTLSVILKEPELRVTDFCDDRLGRLLDRLSDDEDWIGFEQSLGKKIIKVYRLDKIGKNEITVSRSDSFNAPQFRERGGIFQHGYSKQRRRDQPFCKVMVTTIDSVNIPIAVDIVKGSGPDTALYLPVINRVQSMLEENGNLYVGDSQLGSLPNRKAIHLSGDYYLSPLNKKQVSLEKVSEYLDRIKVPYEKLPSMFTEDDSKRKAAYYHELTEMVNQKEGEEQWEERRILVYSPDYAKGLQKSLNGRISEAEEKIKNLVISKCGRRNPKTLKGLYSRINSIVKTYKVDGFFNITCKETIKERKVNAYKDRPEEIRKEVTLSLQIERKEKEIELKKRDLGWQIYGTNVPQDLLDTSELVKTYRDEYKIEHLFNYMINRDVGLLPLYLKKENRVKGLIRLLTVAMKFSMLIQHDARALLTKENKKIKNVYPGNKNRATSNPTITMLLRAFKGVSAAWLDIGGSKQVQMVGLTDVQQEVLRLLKIPDVYADILEVFKTGQNLRET